MTTLQPPAPLRDLLARIAASARNAEVYLVGGTVRDLLLGRDVRDLDVASPGDAVALARALAGDLGGHFVPLDEEWGVARVVLDGAAARHVDVARLQRSLEEDMRRRDFTVNALAARLDDLRLIDLRGGLADLEARLVRMNAADVFDDDPLRLLRAARLAGELGFDIDDETAAEIRRRPGHVLAAAPERRRDELAHIFALDDAHGAVRLLDHLGLLDALLPELGFGRGVSQPQQFHAFDVFEHNLRALEAMDVILAERPPAGAMAWLWDVVWEEFAWCEQWLREDLRAGFTEERSRAALLKLAALLHDVGKPQTRSADADNRIRFFGHADAGAEIARRTLRAYRFSSKEVEFVSRLVAEHLRPVQLAQVGEVPSRRALFRFYRALGDAAPAVLLLALADGAAARGAELSRDGWRRQVRYMNSLLVRSVEEEGIVNPPRLLTGHDIMAATGIAAGPAIGRVLEAVREAQAAGEVTSREEALALVRRLAREGATER